jgi:hypothetical protein
MNDEEQKLEERATNRAQRPHSEKFLKYISGHTQLSAARSLPSTSPARSSSLPPVR